MEITVDDHASIDVEGHNSEDHGKDRRKMPRLQELLQKFKSSHPPSSECCIFRVPEKLQKSYKEAYTPRVIAIGPYHSGNQSLERMQKNKLLYLSSFLEHSQMSVDDFIKGIDSQIILRIRSCYDEQIHLRNDYLADMMVLDGIFMIQLFLIHGDHKHRPHGDRIFGKPWMLNNIRRDMMLLENQIPFFVIQELFDMAHRPDMQPGLLNLVYSFFSPVTMTEVLGTEVEVEVEEQRPPEVKHLLDAIRFSYLSAVRRKPSSPAATDPAEAGVNPRQSGS